MSGDKPNPEESIYAYIESQRGNTLESVITEATNSGVRAIAVGEMHLNSQHIRNELRILEVLGDKCHNVCIEYDLRGAADIKRYKSGEITYAQMIDAWPTPRQKLCLGSSEMKALVDYCIINNIEITPVDGLEDDPPHNDSNLRDTNMKKRAAAIYDNAEGVTLICMGNFHVKRWDANDALLLPPDKVMLINQVDHVVDNYVDLERFEGIKVLSGLAQSPLSEQLMSDFPLGNTFGCIDALILK
jgi:hypothetical protein